MCVISSTYKFIESDFIIFYLFMIIILSIYLHVELESLKSKHDEVKNDFSLMMTCCYFMGYIFLSNMHIDIHH